MASLIVSCCEMPSLSAAYLIWASRVVLSLSGMGFRMSLMVVWIVWRIRHELLFFYFYLYRVYETYTFAAQVSMPMMQSTTKPQEKSVVLPLRITPELAQSLADASEKTKLSQQDVARLSLARGIDMLISQLTTPPAVAADAA